MAKPGSGTRWSTPFFRIFNPIVQGEKFDGAGGYVRRWIPELSHLPNTVLHSPWKAGAGAIERAAVPVERRYPDPIVDHSHARQRALASFQALKTGG